MPFLPLYYALSIISFKRYALYLSFFLRIYNVNPNPRGREEGYRPPLYMKLASEHNWLTLNAFLISSK